MTLSGIAASAYLCRRRGAIQGSVSRRRAQSDAGASSRPLIASMSVPIAMPSSAVKCASVRLDPLNAPDSVCIKDVVTIAPSGTSVVQNAAAPNSS
ncbi:hypothetical protein Bxe_C0925 [Paraburkholderia xenovorans LB400]|uniref:Uncharacterized protein n=1 Tax=Paraburkholderia xenovorans (strain LB400) TaxID=266265 RepID=Q13GI9_PARXL|nr:hypothetical protein Bxe_C0925 [Paraburkholderia xenovorans LB400]